MATKIADLKVLLSADDKLSPAVSQAQKSLKDFGLQAVKVGGVLTASLSVPLGALGRASINTAKDFDEVIRTIQGVARASGAGQEELDKLREVALQSGKGTVFTAQQIAVAMQDMVKDGLTPAQIAGGQLDAVMKLASATGDSLSDTQIALSDTMQAFGFETSQASEVMDVFGAVLLNTPANLTELADAMKVSAPIASGLGVSIEDLAVQIAILAQNGVRGGEAGTSLRRGLINLASPVGQATELIDKLGISTEELASSQAEAGINAQEQQATIKALGLQVFDAQGNFNDLSVIMEQLRHVTAGMTQEQRAQTLVTLFGVKAYSQFEILIGASADQVEHLTNKVNESNKVQLAGEERLKGMSGASLQLEQAMERTRLEIGDAMAPALIALSKAVIPVLEGFNELSPASKAVLVGIGALLVVLPPLIVLVGGLALSASGLGIALAPLAITIATVAGIVVGLIWIFENLRGIWQHITGDFEESESVLENMGSKIKEMADETGLMQMATEGASGATQDLNSNLPDLSNLLGDVGEDASKTAEKLETVTKKIADLNKQVLDLEDDRATGTADLNRSTAERIIEQQKLVSRTEAELLKARGDLAEAESDRLDSLGDASTAKEINRINVQANERKSALNQRVLELENTLERERTALENSAELQKTLGKEILEAQRRDSLTAFERFLEDQKKRQLLLEKEYAEKKLKLLLELQDQIKQRDALVGITTDKVEKEKALEIDKANLIKEQTTATANHAITESNRQTEAIVSDYQKVIDARNRMNASKASSFGGFGSQSSTPAFSFNVPFLGNGGIVNAPTLAVIGDAGREAVLPLDQGGGFGNNIYITGNTILADTPDAVAEAIGDKLIDTLNMQMRF